MELNKPPVRQGDVLMLPLKKPTVAMVEIPVTPEGKIVLALGEATGHHHRIEGVTKSAPKARLWSAGAERWLQVITACELIHEEHSAAPLEPGWYQLPQQVDMSSDMQPRRVED